MTALLAQVEIRERGDSCVADNGFCPDWILDNLDRYDDPLIQHLYLTLVSVAIGFAIAFALAVLAHRRRWLIAPVTQVTGVLYTVPSIAAFFLLLPITGRGNTDGDCGTGRVLAARDLPECPHGAGKRAGGNEGRRARHGVDRPPAPVARGGAARAARDHGRPADRGHHHRGARHARLLPGAGGLGERIFKDIVFKSNVVVAGGLAVLLAAVLDGLILVAQRASTPWTRAAG